MNQRPIAWAGEGVEDVAVFDDAALAALEPEAAREAMAVREAIREILADRGIDGLKRLAAIPRGSAFSEWRLFLRGLAAWLAGDLAAASEAWRRLDPERRPGRIATTMEFAARGDFQAAIAEVSAVVETSGSAAPAKRCDARQQFHAKLLRRVRFDRVALRVAEAGLSVPEEERDALLSPATLRWIQQFIKEYGDTEPNLAAAIGRAALLRAWAQEYNDVFDGACRAIPGARHDPNHLLLTYFYYRTFEGSGSVVRAAQALKRYLETDLPRNDQLTPALRGAIAGEIHLEHAEEMIRQGGARDLPGWARFTPDDSPAIRASLEAAAKACPENQAIHKTRVDWIEDKLDDERLKAAERKELEAELAQVMRAWTKALPGDVEPRLWLVDHFLDNERLDEARPHVEFLAASRHDEPLVRAVPWKWELLEAMRLCRRKSWLAEADARFDAAEAIWPTWLPRHWVPYLRAALLLRAGRREEFEAARQRIREQAARASGSLVDACMMVGAAQMTHVSAADLKPLREALDRILGGLDTLSFDDLIETCGFFWDLSRVNLLYPAHRMHGPLIDKALRSRLEKEKRRVRDGVDDPKVQAAVLWAAHRRCWVRNSRLDLPSFFDYPAIKSHPMFLAARAEAFLSQHAHFLPAAPRNLGPALREAAGSQRDAYYRRWFVTLADLLDEAEAAANEEKRRLTPFWRAMEADFEIDDDLDYDPNCDCEHCRAARRAREKASQGGP